MKKKILFILIWLLAIIIAISIYLFASKPQKKPYIQTNFQYNGVIGISPSKDMGESRNNVTITDTNIINSDGIKTYIGKDIVSSIYSSDINGFISQKDFTDGLTQYQQLLFTPVNGKTEKLTSFLSDITSYAIIGDWVYYTYKPTLSSTSLDCVNVKTKQDFNLSNNYKDGEIEGNYYEFTDEEKSNYKIALNGAVIYNTDNTNMLIPCGQNSIYAVQMDNGSLFRINLKTKEKKKLDITGTSIEQSVVKDNSVVLKITGYKENSSAVYLLSDESISDLKLSSSKTNIHSIPNSDRILISTASDDFKTTDLKIINANTLDVNTLKPLTIYASDSVITNNYLYYTDKSNLYKVSLSDSKSTLVSSSIMPTTHLFKLGNNIAYFDKNKILYISDKKINLTDIQNIHVSGNDLIILANNKIYSCNQNGDLKIMVSDLNLYKEINLFNPYGSPVNVSLSSNQPLLKELSKNIWVLDKSTGPFDSLQVHFQKSPFDYNNPTFANDVTFTVGTTQASIQYNNAYIENNKITIPSANGDGNSVLLRKLFDSIMISDPSGLNLAYLHLFLNTKGQLVINNYVFNKGPVFKNSNSDNDHSNF